MASRYEATKQGGPFELVSVPKPTPSKNEVVIRLKAVALNPIDYKQLKYGLFVQSWPVTFGSDGAGIVEAVGEGVHAFKPGDEVLARFNSGNERGASFQHYAVVEESALTPKPKSWTFEDAAALPTTYVTAAGAIYNDLGIPLPFLPGSKETGFQPDSILVLGGSSGVGASAILLLRLALPNATIIATSSPKHHGAIRSLGANATFDYKSSTIVEDIKKASPTGNGVEAIIDAVNSVALNLSLLQVLTGPKEFAEVATGQNVKDVPSDIKHHLVFGASVLGAPGGSNLFSALGTLLKEEKYRLPTPVTVVGQGLEAIGPGLERLEQGISGTKLVVTI